MRLTVACGPTISYPTLEIDEEGNSKWVWHWVWTTNIYTTYLKEVMHIFIHIPKCGGTSINSFYPNPRNQTVLCLGHCFAEVYPDWCRSKMFAVVRNPYSRLVSAYRFMQKGGFRNDVGYSTTIKKYPTFEEWVLNGITPESRTFHPGKIVTELLVPQYRFLYEDTHRKKVIVPHILKFENYAEEIERHLAIPKQLQLCTNVTQRTSTDWRVYYINKDVQNKVYTLYFEDFKLFGYDYEIEGS